jgi:hypothetical protein
MATDYSTGSARLHLDSPEQAALSCLSHQAPINSETRTSVAYQMDVLSAVWFEQGFQCHGRQNHTNCRARRRDPVFAPAGCGKVRRGVLASVSGSTERSVRLASSFAGGYWALREHGPCANLTLVIPHVAHLADGLSQHPEVIAATAPYKKLQPCFLYSIEVLRNLLEQDGTASAGLKPGVPLTSAPGVLFDTTWTINKPHEH